MRVDQRLHLLREVLIGALRRHLDVPPAGERLEDEEQIGGATGSGTLVSAIS
jgi:hypothetical protein